MLRKRSRPVQKEQSKLMSSGLSSESTLSSHGAVQKTRIISFFSVPRLFVGFNNKGLLDSDAVRSPTSPLDYRVFGGLGSSFLGSPRSPRVDKKPKCWDSSRVGLGLVDTLNEEDNNSSGRVLGFSESKKILFGPQLRVNTSSSKSHLSGLKDESLRAAPKSLPKDYGILSNPRMGSPKPQQGSSKRALGFKGSFLDRREFGVLRTCSADLSGSSLPATRFLYQYPKSNSEVLPWDSNNLTVDSPKLAKGGNNFDLDSFSGSIPISFDSSDEFVNFLSESEIEQSEDYTCIISHGPNPKTTRIFGNCILESQSSKPADFKNKYKMEEGRSSWLLKPSEDSPPCPSDDFLSSCFSCKKKLEEGKDIYMYRGEKAFCSCDCRDQEILIEEEMRKPAIRSSDSPGSSFHEEIFLEGMVMAL